MARPSMLAAAVCALVAFASVATAFDSDKIYADITDKVAISLHNGTVGGTAFDEIPTTCAEDIYHANCLTKIMAGEDNVIKVQWSMKPGMVPDTTTGEFKLLRCYSPESKADRPWRKFKPVIEDDKQCVKIEEEIAYDMASDSGPWTYDYKIKDNHPKGTYYVMALIKCSTDPMDWCAKGTWTAAGGGAAYYQVTGIDPVTSSLRAGAITMSIVAWLFLIGYFILEKSKKKQ